MSLQLKTTMTAYAPNGWIYPYKPFLYKMENLLPPSRTLMGLPPAPKLPPDGFMHRTCEIDVGISQYIGDGTSEIHGIIKQRFTDFMVYEIDIQHKVVHIDSIERPIATQEAPPASEEATEDPLEPWPASFTSTLGEHMQETTVEEIKALFLAGPKQPSPEPPAVQETPATELTEAPMPPTPDILPTAFVGGKDRKKKGRGKGDGKGQEKKKQVIDDRKVVSEPISSKEARYGFHKVIREVFKGKLETFTEEGNAPAEGGSRIVIKWAGTGRNKGTRRGATDRDHQPYIHFTLQKTNRDTSDVLTHLSRVLKTDGRNLTVAGTKDKRAVTCQRVCLKRCGMTVEEVWDKINSPGRRTMDQIMRERGERGVRISDITYRKGHLQLGMLKGNEFLITLRNVKAPSLEAIDKSMDILKTKGFINYYGMQRFGTASIPTHAIGLALLRSQWSKAIDLILRPRPGEAPDIQEARLAWALERNADKALQLMPRRVVAERCILESFQRMGGESRNLVGALSTIPRNLRMMYVHAYQSYVWNAIVSERIKRFGHDVPVPGDIVFEDPTEGEEAPEPVGKGRGPNSKYQNKRRPPRKVKVLTEEDVSRYTIYDVVMPLPGTDVDYPGGALGELYKSFLRVDGLNPEDFSRKQREYSLAGSYRKILHCPKEVSWKTMRYTDPEIPLAQSDEDRILGIEEPQTEEDGLFLALQIRLQLGTACYATMALREITKIDTSTHVQTMLTNISEDQTYKGTGVVDEDLSEEALLDEIGVEAEAIDNEVLA
ncbi:tRNA pseudouridine synthase D [Serendipita vermifera]|nr:tRNA pseudouridine synthase D [Serendipita vermifera]